MKDFIGLAIGYLLDLTQHLSIFTRHRLNLTGHWLALTNHLSGLTGHRLGLAGRLSDLTRHLSGLTSHLLDLIFHLSNGIKSLNSSQKAQKSLQMQFFNFMRHLFFNYLNGASAILPPGLWLGETKPPAFGRAAIQNVRFRQALVNGMAID